MQKFPFPPFPQGTGLRQEFVFQNSPTRIQHHFGHSTHQQFFEYCHSEVLHNRFEIQLHTYRSSEPRSQLSLRLSHTVQIQGCMNMQIPNLKYLQFDSNFPVFQDVKLSTRLNPYILHMVETMHQSQIPTPIQKQINSDLKFRYCSPEILGHRHLSSGTKLIPSYTKPNKPWSLVQMQTTNRTPR